MALDVLSPRGQKAVAYARRGLFLVGQPYVETRQDVDGDIDGFFLSSNNEVVATFECKSRDMSLAELRGRFKNEWILTFEKVSKGAAVARATRTPLLGVVYLTKDDKALVVRIADEYGNIVAPMRLAVTETQATCNGGAATRTNAYINMGKARLYEERSLSCAS